MFHQHYTEVKMIKRFGKTDYLSYLPFTGSEKAAWTEESALFTVINASGTSRILLLQNQVNQ